MFKRDLIEHNEGDTGKIKEFSRFFDSKQNSYESASSGISRKFVENNSMTHIGKTHEQSFNIILAGVLKCQRSVLRDATVVERMDVIRKKEAQKTTKDQGLRPDIFIEAPELSPVIVEVKFDDSRPPEEDAKKRLLLVMKNDEEKTIHTVIVVKAPSKLRQKSDEDITHFLKEGGTLQYACLHQTEKDKQPERWPEKGYLEGTVSDLADVILQSATITGQLSLLAKEISEKVKNIGDVLLQNSHDTTKHFIKERLGQSNEKQGMYVAVCIWLNALIFQERIASDKKHKNIPLLNSLISNEVPLQKHLQNIWGKILQINYSPIFEPARDCLESDFPLEHFKKTVEMLIKLVETVSNYRMSSLVDVSASVFPLLSDDRKTAAAFYTKPEAAEMLVGLCLPSPLEKEANDTTLATFSQKCWGNKKKLLALRILDPACGTGTLLRATYRRIRALYEQQGEKAVDLHDGFISDVLHGIDIKAIAIHLTVTSLSGVESLQPYKKTNIAKVDVKGKTGALELIERASLEDLFSSQTQTSHGQKNGRKEIAVSRESQDLVIMNPPYSRTRGKQSLFDVDGQNKEERLQSQERAQKILKGSPANLKAGMASAFMYLAHKKLKPGGILGSVLPLTAASQKSWASIRRMLEKEYKDIVVVAIASDKQNTFSADTGMGEMLLVARKRSNEDTYADTHRLTINMKRTPLHLADATEMAKAINKLRQSQKQEREGMFMLTEKTRIGKWIRTPPSTKTGQPWGEVGMKDVGLAIAINGLQKGYLVSRDGAEKIKLPLEFIPLGDLFSVGPTHHLIGHCYKNKEIGAFELHSVEENENPKNPSLWEADCKKQKQLIVKPTHQGVEQDRELAKKMREKRSTLFIARNMRWTSQSLLAAMTKTEAMGGRAWTALLQEESVKKAFVFWANSTLGMLLYWMDGGRQQQGRSLIQVKALADIPSPNFAADTEQGQRARTVAERHFSSLQHKHLKMACLSWKDDTRKEIDRVVAEMLAFEDRLHIIDDLRKSWCLEPSVHGGKQEAMKHIKEEDGETL